MDDCQHTRSDSLFAMAGIFLAIEMGCRMPALPILNRDNHGVIYDTALEDEIRSRKAHQLVLEAYGPYVDTLAEPVAVCSWSEETAGWNVFAATNRGWYDDPGDRAAANQVLESPQYGVCRVDLPRGRPNKSEVQAASDFQRGKLASVPSAVLGSKPIDVAHVESTPLSADEFLEGVNEQLARSRQQDLLLFVHGFNVSFDGAVTRAAQIAFDIPFNGAVCAYCWPSQGGISYYDEDEPINKATVEPFREFLLTLRNGIPESARIHIVVHSMGNRFVMEALDSLPAPSGSPPIGNLLLCAPDVGISDFKTWAPGVVEQCERVTLYANQSDSALIVSKGIHAEARAGDAQSLVILDGIETIDCSRINTSFMGHSYYGSNQDMLIDLFMVLKEDQPPSQRPHLKRKKHADGEYWEIAKFAGRMMYAWHFDEVKSSAEGSESEPGERSPSARETTKPAAKRETADSLDMFR